MIQSILVTLFFIGIIGIIISYMAWNRTGPRQPSDEELFSEARKAIDMSARIARESRENIRRMRRVM